MRASGSLPYQEEEGAMLNSLHHETRRKIAASARPSQAHLDYNYRRMRRGPYLEDSVIIGEQMIVVPSEWYRDEAKDLWKGAGFRFEDTGAEKNWVRTCSLPFDPGDGNGPRVFTAEAWRKWARAKFYDLWRSELLQHGDLVLRKDFIRERDEVPELV
jgi:hypothetical protein